MKFEILKELENKGGIYKISNSVNDKIYIGRTCNFLNRFRSQYAKIKERSCNRKMCELLLKIKFEDLQFSIVEVCEKSLLKEKEEFYIKQYDVAKCGLNFFVKDRDFANLSKHGNNRGFHNKGFY